MGIIPFQLIDFALATEFISYKGDTPVQDVPCSPRQEICEGGRIVGFRPGAICVDVAFEKGHVVPGTRVFLVENPATYSSVWCPDLRAEDHIETLQTGIEDSILKRYV